jgi:predicted dienelactone hydrolase
MALKLVADEAARDPDGFDRDALHQVMNREIVGFFDRTLRPAGNTPSGSAQPASCRSPA